MTKREYAISKGLAQPGRGRLSRDAHDAIAKAEAEGMVFDDTTVVVRQKALDVPVVNTEKAVDKGPKDSIENPFADAYMRYEQTQEFVYDEGGREFTISCRPACMNCGYSLVGHTCNDPVVLTYHGVKSVHPKGLVNV